MPMMIDLGTICRIATRGCFDGCTYSSAFDGKGQRGKGHRRTLLDNCCCIMHGLRQYVEGLSSPMVLPVLVLDENVTVSAPTH